jgi:hypothetical protein
VNGKSSSSSSSFYFAIKQATLRVLKSPLLNDCGAITPMLSRVDQSLTRSMERKCMRAGQTFG